MICSVTGTVEDGSQYLDDHALRPIIANPIRGFHYRGKHPEPALTATACLQYSSYQANFLRLGTQ